MPKIEPVIARSAEELASAFGLPESAVKEWQVQHELVKRLKGGNATEEAHPCGVSRNGPAHHEPE